MQQIIDFLLALSIGAVITQYQSYKFFNSNIILSLSIIVSIVVHD